MAKEIWSKPDIYWVTGIIEGEGCFTLNKYGQTKYPRVRVVMTDEDIIKRLQSITGIGIVRYQHSPSRQMWKPSWIWDVAKKKEVSRLLLAIYPLLGSRRKLQLSEVI